METGTCDSCGEEGATDLVALHRLYVTPESWDQEGSVRRDPDVERWCAACRSHYPHEPLGADPPADADAPAGA